MISSSRSQTALDAPSAPPLAAPAEVVPVRSHARWRRAVTAAVGGLLATSMGLIAFGGAASAEPLPTNALAFEVVATAREAIAALDEFDATADLGDLLEYKEHRTETARLVAQQLGYGEVDMIRAWSATPLDHQRAVLAAMTQVGVPYRTNTSEEGVGFDCSGLTTYAWARAGVDLIRQSRSQINEAAPLDRTTAKAGDLAWYPGHVMMYLGVGDAIIHSVQRGRTVEIDTISDRRTNSVRFGDPTL